MIEYIKKVEILREGCFFSDERVIGRNYRYKGEGACESFGKLRGVIRFLNGATSHTPPHSLIKNERSLTIIKLQVTMTMMLLSYRQNRIINRLLQSPINKPMI